ncbi:MAG: hypothetical protein LBS89_06580, partial [Zoogloeaceae bacterium]|nr:hypothetical protein [Zoogloeaceae bacterium]
AWFSWSTTLPGTEARSWALFIPDLLLYVLTLPTGLLVPWVYAGLAQLSIGSLDTGHPFLDWMLERWCVLTIVGYLQWFVFVPRVLRFWRKRNQP